MKNLYIILEIFTNGYQPIALDIISLLSILSGIFVIITSNPVLSIVFLIALFVNISCYLVLIGMHFLGLSYLLVYIGGVSMLFIFVIMLINIRVSELQSNLGNSLPLGFIISILFYYPVWNSIRSNSFSGNSKIDDIEILYTSSAKWDTAVAQSSDIASIGSILYSSHFIWLFLAALILLLSMVGAIVITISKSDSTGSISNYKPKNTFSNQQISLNSRTQKRSYSTDSRRLNPQWITGFVDGEGAFGIGIYRQKTFKTGWCIIPYFSLQLHKRDLDLMYRIQSFFSAGNITVDKSRNSVNYAVHSIEDLNNKIIPHFMEFPLLTQKHADFLLFKSIIDLMMCKEHLTIEGIRKILSFRASANSGLTDVLKESFPNIIPAKRPIVKVPKSIDPDWLVGFSEAEGCFSVVILKSKTYKSGFSVLLRFILAQHSRDTLLFNSIQEYLGCGIISQRSSQSLVCLTINKFSDNFNKIIPFFDKYPLQGNKKLDYLDFCKAAALVNDKTHLTDSGLELIREIKSGMNKGR
jgi:NADH:ubiquinone oxidoreductase subunit 6 (subunit J)